MKTVRAGVLVLPLIGCTSSEPGVGDGTTSQEAGTATGDGTDGGSDSAPAGSTSDDPQPGSTSSGADGSEGSEGSSGQPEPGEPIDLERLQTWTRVDGPVLTDVGPDGYGVAADIQVFVDERGGLGAVYTGPNPDNDFASIKLATASSHTEWTAGPVLLGSEGSPGPQRNKETSFYRRSDAGTHQIYFIGYEDEEEYAAQIFVAEADALDGPYALREDPVVPAGMQGPNSVFLMTSPSIVEHDGMLYMTYCAWDAAVEEVTAVWVHGATSDDDGQTWTVEGEVAVPVCMEGAMTKGPDGMIYAVAQVDGASISLGRSETPFGEYEMLPDPVLTLAGPPWEVDELNTPTLFFGDDTAYLYYSGADYQVGWWTMVATADFGEPG